MGKIIKDSEYSQFETYDNFNQNFYAIRVFYTSLEYTTIEQISKMQIFDLIANIGATFGLYLGFSFLSSAEIIIMLAEIFFILIE